MTRKFYLKIRNKLLFLTIIFIIFSSGSIIFFSSSRINLKDNSENSNSIINDKLVRIRTSSNNPPNSYYFDYYKPIIIDHQMVFGSGSHANFPVLISLLDSDLHDHVNQSNGNDIAFANDTAWLDHEIELFDKNYDDTYAQLIAWVRIPRLSTSVNTTIYMYYGNATMSSRQDPTGVWGSAYQGVWHLSQLSGSVLDSTSYNTLGTVSGTVNRSAIGQIDGAYDFKSTGMINFGDPSCLDMGTRSFTISFWIKFYGSTGGYQLPIYKGSTTEFDPGYDIETNTDASSLGFRISDGGGHLQETDPVDIFEDYNSWMFLTGVVNRTSNLISIFKNGLQVGTPNSIAGIGNLNNTNDFYASWDTYYIDGLLDEIRVSNTPLSADWIRTEYSNQHDPGTFYTIGSEIIIDIIPPTYSNLIESSDPLELGETEVINITVSDPSGISQVKIEFEGTNHSMTNIGGDIWQYNSWIPSVVDNYTYTIYMEDNMLNWNSTVGTIEVIDTTPPNYSNLESSDPLELGQTEVIRINVNDFAGISQVKIEFEGTNHSMTNIGGTTWEYNSWTPINWILYQYTVYMEDNNGNWNSTINSIVVQDTIFPSPPILTNSPSGTVSGNLVFDWLDGTDMSGISYYILIIDDEPGPTPEYDYEFNITNIGSASSFYELTETIPSGKYYYFLAQVDGAGHQSSYTMGSFTFNLNSNNNSIMIYIIIGVIAVSTIGSISVITIIRKKSHKKMGPPRKKLPFKVILGHITKVSPSELLLEENESYNVLIQKEKNQYYNEELQNEVNQGINIEEIKMLGEELFSEGAYLEAIKQFKQAKDILSNQSRNEDAALFSDLISGIEGLIQERENRLELLEAEKIEGNSIQIFELYYDIIEISKKLRDLDAVSMFQSELINYFQLNRFKSKDIQMYRSNLEKEADSLSNNAFYEEAAQIYGKCEDLSQFLVQIESDEELINVEKFKNRKMNAMKNNQNSQL